MKSRNIFLLLLSIVLTASCISDNTTNGTGVISIIKIDTTAMQAVYDIDKNETLVITPKVTQEGLTHDLKYTWEIDQEIFSNTPELTYVGNMLGVFQCRLIVENEDGKAFYPFVINVNSPYEQGYTMISTDPQGKSMISFMMTNRTDGVEEHFLEGDCFSVNNSDESFASNVADIVHCDGALILACKGSGTSDDPGTIYYLNDKTMVLENKVSTSDFPEFRPISMVFPEKGAVGVSYPILSENGKVYEFSTTEGTMTQATKLLYTYAPKTAVWSGSTSNSYSVFFWDKEIGDMCVIFNGYGPYYCSSTYMLERKNCNATTNYFNGLEFVTMCLMKQDKSVTTDPDLVVVTRNGILYNRVRLNGSGFWTYNYDLAQTVLEDRGGFTLAGIGEQRLKTESPIVGSAKYLAILFADGNNVYRWNYTTNQQINQAPVHATFGSASAVVTSITLSDDQEELFVAFYEPEQPGLNGHVWVVNTDTGKLLRKYENVGYKPVKLIYKKK